MPRLSTARLSGPLLQLAGEQRGLLTVRQLAAGDIDRAAMRALERRGALFPVLAGVRALAPAAELAPSTMIRAARLVVGGGAACLDSAAELYRAPTPIGADPRPRLTLPKDATRHQTRGVQLHWMTLAPDDLQIIDGIPVTTPLRLFRDASKKWDRADVVALLDAALRSGNISLAELSNLDGRFTKRAKAWAALSDPLSESPLETHTRLLLLDAGLGGGLVSQHLVRSPAGRPLARLDLAVPAAKLGIECDGEGPHGLPEALFRDRHRQDDVQALGWRLLRVTWRDLRTQPEDVLRRVTRALAQSA